MAESSVDQNRGKIPINLWPNHRIYISLRIKLLTAFTILFSLIFIGVFYWFGNFTTGAAMNFIKNDLVDTLNGAIGGVDGDSFRIMVEQGSDNDPRYLNHMSWLKTVHEMEPRATPYTYIRSKNPGEILFIADGLTFTRPESAATFLEPYTPRGPMYQGLDHLTVNINPYTDQWGSWISAYRPILDSDGNAVGAMGIDFTTAYVDEVRDGVRNNVITAFIIAYMTMLLVVVVISRWFTQPLIELTRITEQVGKGNYDQNFDLLTKSYFPDEIVTLTYAYESALGKVRGVVQNLTNQVTELQIVIDESQRKKNVSEIVETDFFRDLQAKAEKMRTQQRHAEATENSKPAVTTAASDSPPQPAT